ncbi:hypothetical protein JW964_12370 [candidate division KSB1 bacterium]|nr:hypothetical protein [candidate division KSB1 bacterium]
MKYLRDSLLIIHVLFLSTNSFPGIETAFSNPARISMDGYFSDWDDIEPVYSDQTSEQTPDHVDFGKLWIANDEQYLYLRIDVGVEVNLQNDNAIALYIDADNDLETGNPFRGIGVDLEWRFGAKIGTKYVQDGFYPIGYMVLKLVTLPTVTSTQFEIAIFADGKWRICDRPATPLQLGFIAHCGSSAMLPE